MKCPILLCLAALLAAQATAPEVEITAEPHHHLTFENKSIRVFNVEVPPNDATLTHWHRHDYIVITLGTAEISNSVKGKPAVTVKFQEGDTRFTSATFAHFVRTTSPQAFRNVTIEILEDASLRNSTAQWDEDRSLDILQGGTKQILFVKDGIRVSEFELQPGAVAPMHHAGPDLFVAISKCDIRSEVQSEYKAAHGSAMPAHFQSGESKWLPGNYARTLTNTGAKVAKFVTLEFP